MKVPTSKVDNYGTGSIHQNKYILCTGKIFMRSGNRSHFGESFESLLFLAFYFRILTQWMRWCRQKFSKKNQAIWAKNEPQKMASLTAGGTCSCIIVECTKNTLHNVIQLYKFNWKGVQALVINKPA